MSTLIAGLSFTRRSVAVTILERLGTRYTEIRHLRNEAEVAHDSVRSLVRKILEDFRLDTVVLFARKDRQHSRVAELMDAATEVIRAAGIPILEVSRQELLDSFGYPPPRTHEFLKICQTLWPYLDSKASQLLEAAAMCLYAHVEQLLSINPEPNAEPT